MPGARKKVRVRYIELCISKSVCLSLLSVKQILFTREKQAFARLLSKPSVANTISNQHHLQSLSLDSAEDVSSSKTFMSNQPQCSICSNFLRRAQMAASTLSCPKVHENYDISRQQMFLRNIFEHSVIPSKCEDHISLAGFSVNTR